MNADFPVTEKVSIHCSVASKTVVLFAPFLSTRELENREELVAKERPSGTCCVERHPRMRT